MKLENKVAIVTGGGKGIGAEISLRLAQEGAKIVIAEMDVESGKNIQKKIKENKGEAIVIDTNVADEISVNKMADETINKFSKIDILINNAGIRHINNILDHTKKQWDEMLSVNLTGPYLCCKAVIPHMIKKSYGTIINIGSTASLKGYKNGSIYSSSKFAVRCLTECWQAELRPYNIRVCQINPSEVTTAFGNPQRVERDYIDNKLTPKEISHSIVSAIEMDDRGFINELNIWATNPFN